MEGLNKRASVTRIGEVRKVTSKSQRFCHFYDIRKFSPLFVLRTYRMTTAAYEELSSEDRMHEVVVGEHKLDVSHTISLIINRIIGTGIFLSLIHI